MFQDVFDFAGQVRQLNISKGNFRFAGAMFLESTLEIIDKMPSSTFDEIVDKYVEMNVAHPFLEGNGRAMRIWLDCMLKKELNLCINWSRISKVDYLQSMERSPVNSLELKYLLKNSLTDETDSREVYMRGVQTSYIYEDLYEIDIDKI